MWVYTAHGEEVGRLHGVSRPAGQQAMCGSKPVDGVTAQAWKDRGYIEWKADDDGKNILDMQKSICHMISRHVLEFEKLTGHKPSKINVSKVIYDMMVVESEPFLIAVAETKETMLNGIPVEVVDAPAGYVCLG